MANPQRLSRHEFLKLSVIASAGLALSACAAPQPAAVATPTNTPPPRATPLPPLPPPVSISNSELWELSSSAIGQDYKILVALPDSYAKTTNHYPVVYVLDGNIVFGITSDTARLLAPDELPEVIVVGIGYPVDNGLATMGFRTRDLTPTKVDGWYDKEFKPFLPSGAPADAGTGGAGQFLEFIRKQVMPLINAKYRTSPTDSAIVGHSFGALFALYALFNQPDAFAHYAIGSPATWWDNGAILNLAQEFAKSTADVSARVFVSAGGDEDPDIVSGMQKVVDALGRNQSKGLKVKTYTFDGEKHVTVIPAFISRGLRSAFT